MFRFLENDGKRNFIIGIFGEDGSFQRISAEYDLTDAIQLSGGFVFYTSGDLRQFQNVGDNDRLFLEIKYHF